MRTPIDVACGRSLILFLLALCVVSSAAAQQSPPAEVSGRIINGQGAALPEVMVSAFALPAAEPLRATITDREGRYRLASLPPGRYRLRLQRVGLVPHEVELTLAPGERAILDFTLEEEPVLLEGIVAAGLRGADRSRARFESEPGITARVVEGAILKSLPGLAEADVLRAIQLLPGVIATSDFSSSYHVRGGATDQNLILIDGFTLFNPFHLGGLFSAFNSDAVERAELFSGGFGSEFGGRVSSVLQVESRTEVPESIEVLGGVSMLASRALVRAPLPGALPALLGGEDGSVFLSARRSYFDQILRPITDFPYHFTDLQGHLSLGTAGGGRLALTTYWGEDLLDLSSFGAGRENEYELLRLRWRFGNQLVGLHWSRPLPAGWIFDGRLGASRFAERLTFADFGDIQFGSRITQTLGRADLSRDLTPTLSTRLGLQVDRTDYRNLAEAGGTTFLDGRGRGTLSAGYGSLRWRPGPRWIVEPGLRLDLWHGPDTLHIVPAPRFSAKHFFGRDQNIALKVAAGRYSQFLHSLRDEQLPISSETWIIADAAVPPVISDQIQVGIESFLPGDWSASAELFARSFSGLTEFNDREDPNDPADDLLEGRGRAYGIDLQLQRMAGRLTGWAALSLLRAEREMPDPLAREWPELPGTVRYPPIFDRRINLDLVGQYSRGPLELGIRWNYGSGLPHTRPVGQHLTWRSDPFDGRLRPGPTDDEGDPPLSVVPGARNAERYPAYHRLDLTVRRTVERSWGTLVPYLQVVNLYDQRNVLFYFYQYGESPPVRSGFSMFPFLPAIGVEVSF